MVQGAGKKTVKISTSDRTHARERTREEHSRREQHEEQPASDPQSHTVRKARPSVAPGKKTPGVAGYGTRRRTRAHGSHRRTSQAAGTVVFDILEYLKTYGYRLQRATVFCRTCDGFLSHVRQILGARATDFGRTSDRFSAHVRQIFVARAARVRVSLLETSESLLEPTLPTTQFKFIHNTPTRKR